ncbi:MAG: hypothetical protein ABUL64_04260 [Singulisphaera sp.]
MIEDRLMQLRGYVGLALIGIWLPIFGCTSQPKPAETGAIAPPAADAEADKKSSDTQPSWYVPGTSHIVIGGPSTDSG